MPSLHTVFALVALSAPPAWLISQSQPAVGACSVHQPGAGPQAWRAAGQDVCGARNACHVWIWDNAALVPANAPATDAGLPKDRADQAVAVWMQDGQRLVTLQRAAATGK